MTEEPERTPVAVGTEVEQLYRTELQRIVRLAYLLTGDSSFAEEAAQEAFARLIPKYSSTRNPSAYLTTTTVNLCRDRARREVTARRHGVPAPGSVPPPGVPFDVEEVWLAVQRLSSQQREAIVLRYWLDLSTREVARILGRRHGTARSLLHRALATLEKDLTDDG
jgi:DNA-directed RNA polymerase specialized sigma24 family protein